MFDKNAPYFDKYGVLIDPKLKNKQILFGRLPTNGNKKHGAFRRCSYEEEFEYLWTTHKDEYCLVGNDSEYLIMGSKRRSMVLIEEGTIIDEIVSNMLKAGVLVFDTREEWISFVESQPDYTTAFWWEDPNVESPFLKNGRPPKLGS